MRITVFFIALFCVLLGSAFAATYIIESDGSGDFPTIQDAVDAALDGDVILLADGTFMGNGNRDIDYRGKAIVIESQNGQPDVCVIDCQGSEAEQHRGFSFHSGEGSESILREITITGGYSTEWRGGGGICCDSVSSPRIMDCVFTENHASIGAGICLVNDSSPEIIDCVFHGNTAGSGGGIAGVHWDSAPTITGCVFSSNSTDYGGGVYFDTAAPTLVDCVFRDNRAEQHGGGLFFMECFMLPAIVDCVISRNSAGSHGGGMYLIYASPALSGCVIAENVSDGTGGGMRVEDSYSLAVTDCTLHANSAASGGGIALHDTEPVLENTIIAFSSEGEAVFCEQLAALTLNCCDVYGNAGGDWVGCIEGQNGVDGNFSADPIFCDPSNGDFTLHAGSPCLPGNHPDGYDCGLIGARNEGCGGTPIVETTWGAMKARFRD